MKQKVRYVAVEGFKLLLAAGIITWLVCLFYTVGIVFLGWHFFGGRSPAWAARKPEVLPRPTEVKEDPEPPCSPNAWVGEWFLDWGGCEYKMTLSRGGKYRAWDGLNTWEGTWELHTDKEGGGKVEKGYVVWWVSESCNPRLPESWLHWGVVLPKKFPRRNGIAYGDCKELVVGMRQRR